MFRLRNLTLVESTKELLEIPEGKVLINTINAHSYNVARRDKNFAEALEHGDYLIPDGISIVKACRWINAKSLPKERIAGADLFEFEMNKLNRKGGVVMFVGSLQKTLDKIEVQTANVYPNLKVITYSPPYKQEFDDEENAAIINAINSANPDLLWIGMTAPKQETWVYNNWDKLKIHCHVGAIGAVFDFFAGNIKRAPESWQRHGLEWLYRLIKEPRRMWKRYLIGNTIFLWHILGEKFNR